MKFVDYLRDHRLTINTKFVRAFPNEPLTRFRVFHGLLYWACQCNICSFCLQYASTQAIGAASDFTRVKDVGMSEAARMIGVSTQTLRRWDRQGVLVAKKGPRGARSYDYGAVAGYIEAKAENSKREEPIPDRVIELSDSSLSLRTGKYSNVTFEHGSTGKIKVTIVDEMPIDRPGRFIAQFPSRDTTFIHDAGFSVHTFARGRWFIFLTADGYHICRVSRHLI